jgi:hypothetical protein
MRLKKLSQQGNCSLDDMCEIRVKSKRAIWNVSHSRVNSSKVLSKVLYPQADERRDTETAGSVAEETPAGQSKMTTEYVPQAAPLKRFIGAISLSKPKTKEKWT